MPSPNRPLEDRVALVTGVSRRAGIAAGIVARLLADGARVYASGLAAFDEEMTWGADADPTESWLADFEAGERLVYREADLADAAACPALVDAAHAEFGRLDIVVATHARSSHLDFAAITADELDRCWAVNARSLVLLAHRLGEVRPPGPGGRFVSFTSGQHIGPMAHEIAYAVTKGAVHQMTATLSDALIERGITVNCVNPGPVDSGWATPRGHAQIEQMFPAGRWGTPADVANLVAWLVSGDGEWMTGEVLNQEGGFRRWARPDPERRKAGE